MERSGEMIRRNYALMPPSTAPKRRTPVVPQAPTFGLDEIVNLETFLKQDSKPCFVVVTNKQCNCKTCTALKCMLSKFQEEGGRGRVGLLWDDIESEFQNKGKTLLVYTAADGCHRELTTYTGWNLWEALLLPLLTQKRD